MSSTQTESRRQEALALPVAVLFWALALGFFWLGSRRWLPDLASEHGQGIDATLIFLLA